MMIILEKFLQECRFYPIFAPVNKTAMKMKATGNTINVNGTTLTGVLLSNGREIFIDTNDSARHPLAYTADGTVLTAEVLFGRSGRKLRTACMMYDPISNTVIPDTIGMGGSTGHGWGCRVVRILWEGGEA